MSDNQHRYEKIIENKEQEIDSINETHKKQVEQIQLQSESHLQKYSNLLAQIELEQQQQQQQQHENQEQSSCELSKHVPMD